MKNGFNAAPRPNKKAESEEVVEGVEVDKEVSAVRRAFLKKAVAAFAAVMAGEGVTKTAEAVDTNSEKFSQAKLDKVIHDIVNEKHKLNVLKHFDGIQNISPADREVISKFLVSKGDNPTKADIEEEIHHVSQNILSFEQYRDELQRLRDGSYPVKNHGK